MRCRAVLTVLLVLAGTLVVAPTAGAADGPSVDVSKTTGLVDGSRVTVTGSGITPGASVDVIECTEDIPPYDDYRSPCPALKEDVVASSTGTLTVDVTLTDLTSIRVLGSSEPVYCRDDGCRIILAWSEGDDPSDPNSYHSVLSDPLQFRGSTATIAVSPSQNLSKAKTVTVSGTAYGAEGHTIKVLEQACFDIVQGNGCYGQLPVIWGKVAADGSYSVRYPAKRFLAGGTDCISPDLGRCLITTIVLDSKGRRDDSFGVSSIGDPGASITFRGAGVSPSAGLSSGDEVQVSANKVSPDTDFQLVQCDYYLTDPPGGGNCGAVGTARSDSVGRMFGVAKVSGLTYHEFTNGDRTPLYCRDDRCRIFVVRVDEQGHGHLEATSPTLELSGAAATATATPSADLADGAWVTVSGTAPGAEGRTIQVVEQACYPRKSFSPCYGQLPVRWGTVKDDGSFSVKYQVRRHLADEPQTDCRDTGTAARCRLSVIVLDTLGRHDDTFGVKRLGQPGKGISFRG